MESCLSAIKEVLSPESRTRKSIERAVELSTTSLSQSATDIDDTAKLLSCSGRLQENNIEITF